MTTSLTPELLNALLKIANDKAYPQSIILDNLHNEQWLSTEVNLLRQNYTVTSETILKLRDYIEREVADAPLYASNPHQAERIGTLAYLLGQTADHPAPAFGCWLLANSYIFTEKAKDAIILYEQARAALTQQGDPQNYIIAVSIGYLAALARTGQPRRALNLAAELEPLLIEQGRLADHVTLLMNVGVSHELLGEYEEALALYRRQMPLAQELGDPFRLACIRHNQAHVMVQLNLFQEALDTFEEAKKGFEKQKATYELRRLYNNLCLLYTQWGDYPKALEQLAYTEELLDRGANDAHLHALFIWLKSHVVLQSRQTVDEKLFADLQKAVETAQLHGSTYVTGLIQLTLAQCAIAHRNWAYAQRVLENAIDLAKSGVGLSLHYQAESGLGQLAEAQQKPHIAASHYEKAIGLIETLRHSLLTEDFRAHFVTDKLHVYHRLIQLYMDNQQPAQAFSTIERIKSRLLAERLNFRLKSETGRLADSDNRDVRALAQQLQETLEEIPQLTLRIQQMDEAAAQPHMKRLEELEYNVQEQIGQLQRDQPLLSPLATGEVISVQALQSLMNTHMPDAIFLQYQIIGEAVWVLPVTTTEILAPLQLTSVTQLNRLRHALYAAFIRILQLNVRRGPAMVARLLPSLLGNAQDLLSELYHQFFTPLFDAYGDRLRPEQHLIIAPDNILYYLPFHAFYSGQHYLLEQYRISYTPSATVLELGFNSDKQEQPHNHLGEHKNALLFGYGAADLTNVAQELAQISRHLSTAHLYQGEEATTTSFITAAPDYALLHIAAHAHFRTDSPLLSSIQMADRPLTLGEIARLPLERCKMAVLSGCETGYGQLQGTDLMMLCSWTHSMRD